MNAKSLKHSAALLVAAVIWGLAFVAQAKGSSVGAFTITGLRNLIGAAALCPVIAMMDRTGMTIRRPQRSEDYKKLWLGGAVCGIALFVAAVMQQLGINAGVMTGKAGFLTAIYILIVPIIGLFLRKRCGWNIWVGVAIALVGLYFLCISGSFSFQPVDMLLIGCAFFFGIQITCIDHFSPLVDPVRLSAIEFLVCGLVSSITAVFVEVIPGGGVNWIASLSGWDAWLPILYLGFLSTGVAYTLQVVGQAGLNPTVASMIMSMEAVFSVLGGWLIYTSI